MKMQETREANSDGESFDEEDLQGHVYDRYPPSRFSTTNTLNFLDSSLPSPLAKQKHLAFPLAR